MALFIAPESSFVPQTNYLLVKNPSFSSLKLKSNSDNEKPLYLLVANLNFSSYTEIEAEQNELTIEASVLVDASLLGMGENLAVFNCWNNMK